MTKELIIIALAIWIIYLYYQQKKQNHLTNFTGSDTPEGIQEIKKVNQIMAEFCRNEIGGQDINEIRSKLNGRKLVEILEENEDYETEVDELKRKKGELEMEVVSLSNAYKNRVSEKENIIKRLEGEKAELKKKVNNKAKQLDEEQCENNKLTNQITSLETKITELQNQNQQDKQEYNDQLNWTQKSKEQQEKLRDEEIEKLKQERDNFKKELDAILDKWYWDDEHAKSSEEFISKMEPFIRERTEEMEELEKFYEKHEIKSLNELEERLENKKKLI